MEPWMKNSPQDLEPIADPAEPSKYIIPGSHFLDPPYSWSLNPNWPRPRTPNAYESESRAPGTGMIGGLSRD